jgi:hypothetical protein
MEKLTAVNAYSKYSFLFQPTHDVWAAVATPVEAISVARKILEGDNIKAKVSYMELRLMLKSVNDNGNSVFAFIEIAFDIESQDFVTSLYEEAVTESALSIVWLVLTAAVFAVADLFIQISMISLRYRINLRTLAMAAAEKATVKVGLLKRCKHFAF